MVVLRFPARESRSLHEPRNRSHYPYHKNGPDQPAERERVAAFLRHPSESDRAKVFGGTAARMIGFA
jgi:hypothetical protein